MAGLWNCQDARPAISTEAVSSALVQLRRPFRQLRPGEHRLGVRDILEDEHASIGHLLRAAAKHAVMNVDGYVGRLVARPYGVERFRQRADMVEMSVRQTIASIFARSTPSRLHCEAIQGGFRAS